MRHSLYALRGEDVMAAEFEQVAWVTFAILALVVGAMVGLNAVGIAQVCTYENAELIFTRYEYVKYVYRSIDISAFPITGLRLVFLLFRKEKQREFCPVVNETSMD